MEEQCFRCLRSNKEVKLLDAVYGNEVVQVCEECSVVENMPVIRKPSSFQLKESEKPYTVYQRLSRMAGIPVRKEKMPEINQGITLDNLRKPKDYSKTVQEKQTFAKNLNKPLDLIDNFNWYIQKIRRERKLTMGQLASLIGESEITLKFIEQGNLPDNGLQVIEKIEQFFKIKLKKSEVERELARLESVKKPVRILSFDKESVKNLTISDLKKMKDARENIEREEAEIAYARKVIWNPLKPSQRAKPLEKKEEEKKQDKKSVQEEKLVGDDIEIIEE